eukprot:CAMPEP_0174718802 /NCGR_PEP_ID=MMETSP1094-20130205/30037_1 /TAXON_ID=156173 /ORGANISM="Chrysochromulina brevifilum, Strain UTEX LB 985" /LENGTH=327 /DNA_ID=CAMNT_0015918995 /DNA_START=236 /DNA_END=1220 /DNA_ORIENTATION=+
MAMVARLSAARPSPRPRKCALLRAATPVCNLMLLWPQHRFHCADRTPVVDQEHSGEPVVSHVYHIVDVQEHLEWPDWLAIFGVLGGTTLISVYNGLTDDSSVLTLAKSADQVESSGTIVFAAFAWVLGISCSSMVLFKTPERCASSSGDTLLYLAILMAFAAAMCAAVSVATLRVISSAAYEVSEHGWDVTTSWPGSCVWYAALGLAIDIPMQYFLLQATLTSAPLAIGVPAYQSFVVLTGVIANYVIWGDINLDVTSSASATSLAVAVDIISLSLVIAGLVALCHRTQKRQHEQKQQEGKDPQTLTADAEQLTKHQPRESSRLLGN